MFANRINEGSKGYTKFTGVALHLMPKPTVDIFSMFTFNCNPSHEVFRHVSSQGVLGSRAFQLELQDQGCST